jgi:DNA invertase Pin-like site-specific DNA recombinase
MRFAHVNSIGECESVRSPTALALLARGAIGRRQGWVILDEFPDKGISGSKGRDRRPEFDRLLKAVVRGKIEVVAVWPVNRLSA